MDIQFKCPCGMVLSTPEEKAHERVACTQCGRILVVPRVPVAAGIDEPQQELLEAEEAPVVERTVIVEERRATMSGMAVASLVLGLVGPFLGIMSLVAGILALIFGGVAIRSMSRSPFIRGKGTAIAGMVLGGIDVLLGLTFIVAIYGSSPPEDSLNVVFCLLASIL